MPDPIFIIDKEGKYFNVLGGSERILYDSVDYLKKKSLYDIFPEEIADLFISTIKKTIHTNSLQIIEYKLNHQEMKFNPMDGPKGPQWYEGRVVPFRFEPEGKTFVIWIAINITEKINSQIKLEKTNNKLNKSEEENRILKEILPICSFCKKIRDENGNWLQMEAYIQKYSKSKFSHGICEECTKKYYSDIYRPK